MAPASNRKYLLALFFILFPLYLTWTFDHSLWNPDETRDAGIAREMYVERNFVVPQLNGEAFLEKPPLYYWSCAAVYATFGRITAGLTRLPAALYGFLGVLFTFLIGRRLSGDRVGFMGAVFVGTAMQWFKMSHFALMDSSLAALIAGALYFHLLGLPLLFILFVILAFFAKGFVAVALVGLVVLADLVSRREFRKLALLIVGGAVIFAACVAPWVHGLWRAGGADALRVFFIDNNFTRFVSKGSDHSQPAYYYLGSFLGDFLPWTLLFAAAAVQAWRQENRRAMPGGAKFLWRWFLLIFIFLSVSRSKRSMYLLPAFPAAALLAAAWMERIIDAGPKSLFDKMALAGTSALLLLIGLAIFGGAAFTGHAYVPAVVGVAILVGAFLYLRENARKKNYWDVFLGWFFLTVLALVSANALFIHRLEADRSFLPVVDQVKSERRDATVIGFNMSEMERGVFYFYLEGKIPNFTREPELAAFLASHRDQKVLLLMNKNGLEKLTRNPPDSMRLIFTFRPNKKARSYLLYSNRTETSPS